MRKLSTILLGLMVSVTLISSCKKDDETSSLKNDLVQKTYGPLMVGDRLEFAYAMGSTVGQLGTVTVNASIAGAAGTIIELNTWRRNSSGTDVATLAAKDAATNGSVSTATMLDGFNAATLRYAYIIPAAARGQQVTFNFTSTDKAGNSVSTNATVQISSMEVRRAQVLESSTTGARYYSIADMKAYTEAEVTAGNLSSKIDFIYAYAATIPLSSGTFAYTHSLVSPGSSSIYFPPGFTVPAAWTKNSTLMEKKSSGAGLVYDGQLQSAASTPNSIFVYDLDLQRQSFENSLNFALAMPKDGSVFMKTADGKYTAYVYVADVNATAPQKMTIGVKRIQNF